MSEEKLSCPNCGTLVSKSDLYCRNCGANLTGRLETQPPSPQPSQPEPAPIYERKFSLPKRFIKLLTRPSQAMSDVAQAPEYEGFLIIAIVEFILFAVAISLAEQKIQFYGTNATQISTGVAGLLAGAVFIAAILFVVKWAIKSLIVRFGGDSGSGWDLKPPPP